MKLSLNEAVCTGHGLCYAHAPDLFVDDDQGYGHVIDGGTVPDGNEQQAHEALRICPEGAISAAD
ncbi:ferredoxin [Mycolicibacterium porcinum]|uniref:Ferredoxin n=1 Tax=Mycolicibacterium porcinum TaxID=39693 RepID=A0AAW5SZW6_9MYCO|nr:ferredoxin [Mycolicibacterium porcinum]MCV7388016.1 ferredoxin [Mycolicibacterium porcinum]ORB43449.1 ferredoxin [Mycolicibacterium porcinum]CDO31298.1 putative ferredoxin [Mycolicibacterium vulneris]